MITSKEEVVKFLKNAKSLIAYGKVIFAKGPINLQDIVDIGLTMEGSRQELLSLAVEEYSKGPEPDRGPGD